jgi:hypothetical protein
VEKEAWRKAAKVKYLAPSFSRELVTEVMITASMEK